ncbi:sensor histidine kinase [Streptomyces sp. NPDC060334]|uniref:sensor histidine kinase n=1 Tax=unclassified Streptomyces TaxID=2593676 RepID=UPI0006AF98F5|nr:MULTISPECIES: HAMP domain-containing sensor histidine kinase [unclassified Streptomyces]KOU66634.1 histidine kinase [Streptomyces sp. WM4235]MCX5072914.1 HAMP domain-containing histidine kinase [Streptomyces sp. NBC_00424]MCX5155559.1 HAMP domain-containing histidine kinase [Streptomyces sp. NBC_00291]WUD43788.1 HAMP domain-containing histidine kinase [Streptomyces sp. NBC_00513]
MAATPAPPAAPPKPTWDPGPPEGPFPWLRPTIRIRLTLLYGGMFLIAGILLLSIIYLLAAQALREGNGTPFKIVDGTDVTVISNTCPGVAGKGQPLDQFNAAINACVLEQRRHALDDLLSRSLMALLGLSIIAFAFGYAMAGRVLSPLGKITRTARRVVGSDLTRRIELDGPDDELKELADTFDEMLDRLERAFTAQQRFVANASHELRTPLAINRTLLEVHLSDPGAPVELQQLGKTLLATNERSEQLVEGLLLLARSDNQIIERKPVDLAEVASRAIDQARGEAGAKGVEIRGERALAVVQGNGVLLERIALNLVQNGVRYNVAEGGWVEVTTEVQHGHAVLLVSNTGPVVPAYEVENLFEPFRRLRTERTGSDKGVGLGLSIARSVARAHGGRIQATPREGGGLVMRVTLPL